MVDFFELEAKCKKLKREKSLKKTIVLSVGVVFVGIIVGSIWQISDNKQVETLKPMMDLSTQDDVKIKEEQKIELKKPVVVQQPVVVQKKSVVVEKKVLPKKETNEPMLNVNIDFNEIDTKPKKKVVTPTNVEEIKDVENVKKVVEQKEKVVEKEIIPSKISKSIIQDEEITFEKAYKYAQKDYDNGDYQSSIKWCKIASKINNTDDKIWELYALNLEKLHQKNKAIRVLKTYLDYKEVKKLRELLKRLEK